MKVDPFCAMLTRWVIFIFTFSFVVIIFTDLIVSWIISFIVFNLLALG